MSDDDIRQRVSHLESTVGHLMAESMQIRDSLHAMIRTTLAAHETAIARLSAIQSTHIGMWRTVAWVGAVVVVLSGLLAWLFEHNVTIVLKP